MINVSPSLPSRFCNKYFEVPRNLSPAFTGLALLAHTKANYTSSKRNGISSAVYIDRRWPVSYLSAVMNGGCNSVTGSARTNVFGSREHNFKGTTWWSNNAGFAPNVWRRWLRHKVDNDGGE